MIGRPSPVARRTVRLVSSADHKAPALAPLAASYGARRQLEALESVTSGRQTAQQKGVPGIAPDALAQGYGYTYVNAAFAYPRHAGNRFSPPAWGAWYAAFEIETALAEVAFHLTRALEAAGADYDNTTRYVELLAEFRAEFHDLRDVEPRPECLHPDIEVGYPAGQKLGAELRQRGANGIVYPSVRRDGGTCLVAFWPGLVRNFQKGGVWELTWRGDPAPSSTRVETG